MYNAHKLYLPNLHFIAVLPSILLPRTDRDFALFITVFANERFEPLGSPKNTKSAKTIEHILNSLVVVKTLTFTNISIFYLE